MNRKVWGSITKCSIFSKKVRCKTQVLQSVICLPGIVTWIWSEGVVDHLALNVAWVVPRGVGTRGTQGTCPPPQLQVRGYKPYIRTPRPGKCAIFA